MIISFFRPGDWVVRDGETRPRKVCRIAPYSGWITVYGDDCNLATCTPELFRGVPLQAGNLKQLGFQSRDGKEWQLELGHGAVCIVVMSDEENHIFVSADRDVLRHSSGRISGKRLTIPHLQHLLTDCGWPEVTGGFLL